MKKVITILSVALIVLTAKSAFAYNQKTLDQVREMKKQAKRNFEVGTATYVDYLEADAAEKEMVFRMEKDMKKKKALCPSLAASIQEMLNSQKLGRDVGVRTSMDVLNAIEKQGLIDNECEALGKLQN
jgi:hypothetical protein